MQGEPFLHEISHRIESAKLLTLSFDVSDCPFPEQGLVTSNAAFVLSKALHQKQEGTPEILPLQIARAIVKCASECHSPFQINIGGDGHLNATPSQEFVAKFICRAMETRGSLLLSESSTFVHEEIKPLVPLEVDWTSKYLRLRMKQSEECATFLSHVHQFDYAAQLMLLALCSDPEIDVSAYLQKLGSRQNVPWYIARAQSDLASLPLPDKKVAKFEASAQNFLSAILRLRRSFLLARSHFRPDWYLDGVMRSVRAFYEVYNRPETRVHPGMGFLQLASILEAVLGWPLFQFSSTDSLVPKTAELEA